MKKIISLLGVVLILATLLTMLASCGVEYYVPADNVEDEDGQDTVNQGNSKSEKEKSSLYTSAMLYLRTKDWTAAYNCFVQIPDYLDVADYLARFSYHSETLVIRDVTDDLAGSGTMVYNLTTKFTSYGYFAGDTLKNYTVNPLKSTNTTVQKMQVSAPTASNPNATKDEEYGRPASVQYAEHSLLGQTIKGYKIEYTYANEKSSQVVTENYVGPQSQNFQKDFTYNADKTINTINLTWTRNNNPNNYEFQYVYSNGRLTQIIFVDKSTGGDPTPRDYANYNYNENGQLTSVVYPGGAVDPIQELSVYTGNLNQWVAPNWNEENVYTVTYTYGTDGLLAKEVLDYANSDEKDQVTTYDLYDENGVLTQKTVTQYINVTVDNVTELQLKTYRYNYSKIVLSYDPLA